MVRDIFSWTLWVGLFCCALLPAAVVGMVALNSGEAFAINAVFSAALIGVCLLVARILPHWRTGSLGWALLAILLGVTVGFNVGYAGDTQVADLVKHAGQYDLVNSIAAGISEEFAKGLCTFILLFVARRTWDRPWHGIYAGFFVGLGFEVIENWGYVYQMALANGVSDSAGAIQGWLIRLIFGGCIHAFWAALVGWGLAQALFRAQWGLPRRVGTVLVCYAFSAVTHGVWDLDAGLGVIHYFLVEGVLAGIVIVLLVRTTAEARADRARPRPPVWEAWGRPAPQPAIVYPPMAPEYWPPAGPQPPVYPPQQPPHQGPTFGH